MATYFHGSTSEIQSSADGLQTLYLMNPSYVPYADAPHHPTLLVNSNATNALNLATLTHAPPVSPSPNQQQHVIHGVANILGSGNSDDHAHTRPSLFGENIAAFHGFSGVASSAAAPRLHYNLWGSGVDQPGTPSSSSGGGGFRRPSQQGLSLSLSSQQTNFRSVSGELDIAGQGHVAGTGNSPSSAASTGVSGLILGSKYLKAAQELLDEVVNVGKGIYKEEKFSEKVKASRESNNSGAGGGDGSSGGGENSAGKQVVELSTAQRQELQMKKSKLVNMLDEVEQRYRQYHHQMQIVVSSFEQAAGYGAAKSYTALALRTISKQFRCLKDAISAQIKATSKTLGEDDCLGVKVEGSRLRYVDHHLRQQRALQQLGMIQPNAWRPQRGLPERAVSILRAWLFEHFLHPYPKDSDKVMLAKQTGLARSQVSNWFINARVRLWKPMVEEMYMEEMKDHEQANGSENTRSKELNKELGSTANVAPESGAIKRDNLQPKQDSFNNQNTSPNEISANSSMSPMGGSLQSHSGFHLAGSSEVHTSPNKPRSSEMQNSPSSILSVDMEMKHNIGEHANTREAIERHHKDGYPLMSGNANHSGGFGAFTMEDIGNRFNVSTEQLASRFHGNGVSLTLGLPHNENLSMSGTPHGFLSQNIHLGRRLEMGTSGNEFCSINTPPSSHSGTTYESIDIQNRKRFVAQLLPDFVA
ncbi:BEL1-like homeodomain protein 1 [Vigna unguiculata]|uniref:Pre-B-cell leukemia transcription factor n=1 Tax=Vigna unguiculata TaxID=3917 RepID=A0A4D6NC68_VIGUN|nr:BEL1-like homeodomain protein 1 [Vigna unguiculata]XP_027928121.1 BEL1-like homeodomain protein 1 [Vigna unguiculata]QCE09507.1 pre-B-cell leukemia transcription factor [Vigna unguiculata]